MKNKKLNIATGFVKPKTTSLFFDKIWLPEDEFIDYQEDIPSEILFSLDYSSRKRRKNRFDYSSFHISSMANRSAPFSELDFSNFTQMNSMNLREFDFSMLSMANSIQFESVKEKELESGNKIKYSDLEFISSKNRNKGIKIFTSAIKLDYGVDIVPIYIDSSSFEKDFLHPINIADYNISHPLAIAMEFIPEIIEEKLEWAQVLDIRRDKKSIKKLQKFRTWINADLLNCGRDEIEAKYSMALDEYKSALKKHGIMTTVGTFSTVFDVTATILENLESSIPISVAAGITIATGLSVFTLSQCYSYFENKNKPIAYVYDLMSKSEE